ncbi:hypothetical protein PVK06_018469 [Gossypium arboreum]|uniref:NADH:quinone oxidoreductase/Mrp antiporter transmembrane domain-containing protein n=1 Tax=Gossypium arboreum TaxID=29729 RepID=A0ABR0Q692_GOSAR|nr:hypothetical protein PVK06_018469 [Gossypium arboreum]
MGGASSSILVHGFSWLYGSSGGEIELQEIVNGLINTQMYNSPGISIALIFITVGIGFKLSPALLINGLLTYTKECVAASASATRIFDIPFYFSSNEWHLLLEILAILSMILGNLIAITQTSMKRTFACIVLFGLRTGTDNIRDYAGLYTKDPFLALSLALCLLSLGGLPPLADIIFMEYDSLSRCLGGEMVDTRDSKSRAKERGGSSPLQGIILRMLIELE